MTFYHRSACLGVLAALCTLTCPAAILFETAGVPTEPYPALGLLSGTLIQQAVGFRFQISAPTQITHVGGGFVSTGSTSLFAQIMNISELTNLPDADPYASTGLGRVNFVVADGITDHRLAYDVMLQPGGYALVFGDFGGPIGASLPYGSGPPTSSDFLVWLETSMVLPPFHPISGRWRETSGPFRFVIEGESAVVTPEPASVVLFAGGLFAITAARRFRGRT